MKLAVPVGVTPPPACVIAPPAETTTFRSVDCRSEGRATPTASYTSDTSRTLVAAAVVRFAIAPAAALTLRSLKSRRLATEFTVTVPARSLACVARSTSVAAAAAVSVIVPATVIAPDWLNAFAVAERFWPTDEVPRISAVASVTDASFSPVVFRLTAPVNSLAACVSRIAPAPALNVAAPAVAACVIALDCVMPTAVTVSVPLPTLEAASKRLSASAITTLLAPVFESVTAPPKSLAASSSVIA